MLNLQNKRLLLGKNIREKFNSILLGHISLSLILFAYLFIHLLNLTLLPIFNDESIYLHWGYIEVNNFRDLFHSLYDGKQPLLMWLFGLVQVYISDPLLAGRIVSVIFGLFTTLGIYLVAKKIANEKTALLSSLFYIMIPLFVFYNRQALMEGAVAFVGVWMFYLFLRNIPKPHFLSSLFLGVIIGVGFFIKSSVLVFLVPFIILWVYQFLKQKNNFDRRQVFMALVLTIIASQLILIPLYLQKDFLNIISLGSRYTYTFHELLQFPILHWLGNTKNTFELIFWYLTPAILLLSVFGVFKIWKSENMVGKLLIIWFVMPLIIFIFVVKNPSTRYIVAFLPFATIFCAFGLASLKKKYQLPTLFVSLILPVVLTLLLLFSPLIYFKSIDKVTNLVDSAYTEGWPSGYGIIGSVEFFTTKASKGKIKIFIKSATGNPEDALYVYLRNNKNIRLSSISDITCTGKTKIGFALHKKPIYFVSRDVISEENEICFEEVERFYKPDGKSFVVIYKFVKNGED